MAYDPEVNTPSEYIISKYFNKSASSLDIPNNLEPELKYKILSGVSTFQSIFNTIASNKHMLPEPIRIKANDYGLLSISMDTVSIGGVPTQKIKKAGYQYRVRGNLSASSQESFSQFDATIKSRSENMGSDRIEIETKNGELSKHDVNSSLIVLEASHKPEKLPSVFSEISDKDLRVDALCMTSRFNYYFDLEVEDGLVARYHACADANTFITPDGSIRTGGDLEAEFEITEFISKTYLTEKEIIEKITTAQNKLASILEQHHGNEIKESNGSKLARAAKTIIAHYSKYNHHLQPREAGGNINKYKPTQWPLTLGKRAEGLLTETTFNRLNEFKQAMPEAKDLIQPISETTLREHTRQIS